MAEPILSHFGVTKPQELVRHIYVAGARPSAIAALAKIVGAAAQAGDATASELISLGGRELAMAAASVAKRLGIEREPVLLAGGTLRGLELLRTSLTADLGRRLPGADVRVLSIEPAHGAVRLARAAALGTLQLPALRRRILTCRCWCFQRATPRRLPSQVFWRRRCAARPTSYSVCQRAAP
jgi:N-acetylglucosamine kinase-like BadF-type ATPase